MKKIFITTIGILLLSLSGISYADVLDNYGTINGTANVSGPEFYIGSVANETLLINEKPSSCGGSFGVLGIWRTFRTEELGGIDFNYIPEINMQVRAKGTTTSTSPIKLGLAFGYYNETDIPQYLATTTFSLSNTVDNYSSQNMVASQKPSNVHSFFYKFTKICPSDNTSCSVSINKCDGNGFYTKIELSK